MPALSKEFLDIQETIKFEFTLKLVRDMTKTYSQMHCKNKYSQQRSIIWPVCLNCRVVIYELSGCELKSRCSHLNSRFFGCFEEEVLFHSGNYRVWIHSETRT